jgi:cytochrome c-type biogenesis protein CcmE
LPSATATFTEIPAGAGIETTSQTHRLILGGLAILGMVATLVLNAFQSNLVFFFSPTQVAAGEAPQGKSFRIGGMVKEGSLQRQPDGVTMRFVVTDTDKDMTVAYKGILPDLFREGQRRRRAGQARRRRHLRRQRSARQTRRELHAAGSRQGGRRRARARRGQQGGGGSGHQNHQHRNADNTP